MIDDVLRCYQATNVWDSGAINDAQFYRRLVQAVEDESGTTYRTASAPPTNRQITISGTTITIPSTVSWMQFQENDTVPLDANASFTILHAEGQTQSDLNENSIVVRVDLGSV